MQRSKRKKKKLNKALIRKSVLKISALLMVVSMSWTGFSSVSNTRSYFSDIEISANNTFQVGTLYFSLNDDDFSPDITPAQNTLRTININNNGSLDFDYTVKSDNVSGDLCGSLNLFASLGAYNYNGSVDGFDYSAGQFSTVGGNWQFEINLTSDDLSLQNKSCAFDFVFDGSQIGGAGFSDQETISNTVNSGTWTNVPDPVPAPEIVINEFLANPIGDEAHGEWVELYNNGTELTDVNGWVLYDSNDTHDLVISSSSTDTGNTIMAPGSFLVIARNAGNFSLNNPGDTIRLYNKPIDSGDLINSYTYASSGAVSGKSFSRIPDGSNSWFVSALTPGAPNQLELDESPGLKPVSSSLDAQISILFGSSGLAIQDLNSEAPDSENSISNSDPEGSDILGADNQESATANSIAIDAPVEEVAPTEEIAPVEEIVPEESNITADASENVGGEVQSPEEPAQSQDVVVDEINNDSIQPDLNSEPAIEQGPVVEPEQIAAPADDNSGPDDTPTPAPDDSGDAAASGETSGTGE